MTNREWLLNKMQNMSDEELPNLINCGQVCVMMDKSRRSKCPSPCGRCISEWLKQEHKEKITLSEAERTILENIDKKYKWIARDKIFDELYIFTDKPIKREVDWCNKDYYANLSCLKHLFQFITWENSEPYNIEELLEESK